jgi:tetraacyldisaccharide 4'-kinase
VINLVNEGQYDQNNGARPRWSDGVIRSYMNFAQGRTRFGLWAFLIPASWVTCLWIGVLDFFYRHGLRRIAEPPIPVISVGNLSYGGTNKTPFVETLCRALRPYVPVGIVSRGYGGNNPGVRLIEGGGTLGAARGSVGDEPLLLSTRLPDVPIAVSRDRMRGLRELRRKNVCLAVADDAFQHRRVARDVDVVLIDAACPFGSGHLIPAGILREPPSALRRAHFVVVTKSDQIEPAELLALRKILSSFVPEDRIFNSRLVVDGWALWGEKDGKRLPEERSRRFRHWGEKVRSRRLMAFSAIGNPDSFIRSLEREGAVVAGERRFRDHHVYTARDMREILGQARSVEAEFLSCTEKDIYNLLPYWENEVPAEFPPLLVPRVAAVLDEPERFAEALAECLRPRLVVASNGYGEDAIGVLLAQKLRGAFPVAEVLAFPLVGRGEPYRNQGFTVAPAPSVTPSGGVVKYRLRDLWGDIQAGLFGHIREQQGAWRNIARSVRTPVCVGDVYLLLHTLWGQGIAPLFIATAKTVQLSGHWRIERFLIRRYCRRVWTRDGGSARQLTVAGADAVFAGNPIMDLLGDVSVPEDVLLVPPARSPSSPDPRPKVMLLPGSRARAYDDVKLLLSAVEILQSRKSCDYVMVLAPTLSLPRLAEACGGEKWEIAGEKEEGKEEKKPFLAKNGIKIPLHQGEVSAAAGGARLLIGLGGTANQLCAGMGIPVVSIDEKGKRVQKKLLDDSEILTEPLPSALADCALRILTDPGLHGKMALVGKSRMGKPGALDNVLRYAGSELGWTVRCEVYKKLRGAVKTC